MINVHLTLKIVFLTTAKAKNIYLALSEYIHFILTYKLKTHVTQLYEWVMHTISRNTHTLQCSSANETALLELLMNSSW